MTYVPTTHISYICYKFKSFQAFLKLLSTFFKVKQHSKIQLKYTITKQYCTRKQNTQQDKYTKSDNQVAHVSVVQVD